MEFNWSILAWIAALIFVYIFGLFEGRGQGYKKRKAEEQEEKKRDQPASPSAAPQTITVDDPGLLRIKDENGSFVLDLDGRRVKPSSLSAEQRRRLIELLNIMRPWLEGRPAPSSASSARPTVPPPSSAEPTTLEDRLKAIGSPAAPGKPAAPPATPPPAPRSAEMAKEDRPVAPANSIVGQIDAILQERLAGTALADRGVFLAQSPEGTVTVYVGLTRYSGIDEVPDPEIKAAIRAAIAEWEKKYTPGM